MSNSKPVALFDRQLSAILTASHPLPPDRRSAFLADVASELANLREVGDGIVNRVIMARQRVYSMRRSRPRKAAMVGAGDRRGASTPSALSTLEVSERVA